MLLDYRTATYLMGIEGALEDGRVPADAMTDTCPECGEVQTSLDNDLHVVTRKSNVEGEHDVLVVIGCEGYWVIDPAIAGVDSPNWQPVALGDEVTGVHMAICNGDHMEGTDCPA